MNLKFAPTIIDTIFATLDKTARRVTQIELTKAERQDAYQSGDARFVKIPQRDRVFFDKRDATKGIRGWIKTTKPLYEGRYIPVVAAEEQ